MDRINNSTLDQDVQHVRPNVPTQGAPGRDGGTSNSPNTQNSTHSNESPSPASAPASAVTSTEQTVDTQQNPSSVTGIINTPINEETETIEDPVTASDYEEEEEERSVEDYALDTYAAEGGVTLGKLR